MNKKNGIVITLLSKAVSNVLSNWIPDKQVVSKILFEISVEFSRLVQIELGNDTTKQN